VIFVTVGSAEEGLEFERLVREMDRVAGALGADVLIQRGTSAYEPAHARHVRFLPFEEAMDCFRRADLVVGHCGAGTALNAILLGKPLILVPRRADAGELDTEDHQMELAACLKGRPGIRIVEDVGDLERVVREMLARPEERPEPSERLVRLRAAVGDFLLRAEKK